MYIKGHWQTESDEKTIDDLKKIIVLGSLELHVKEVRRRGNQIKIGDNENKLTDYDRQKNEILEELKFAKYNDIEDLAYRLKLTYEEIIDILDLKWTPSKRTGYSLNPGTYEVVDFNNTPNLYFTQ